MKKLYFTILILLLSHILNGQEMQISIAPTLNDYMYYQFVAGGPNFGIRPGFSTEINYFHITDKKINIGFGVNFQYAQVNIDFPNSLIIDYPPYTETVTLLSFSVKPRYNLKKEFYLSLEPSLDLQLNYKSSENIRNQTGLGLSIGFGKRFKINDSRYLTIEPKIWSHNIIAFDSHDFSTRLTILGLNLGFIYVHKKED